MPVPPKKHLLELDRIVNESVGRSNFLRLEKNENLKGFSKDVIKDMQGIISSSFLTAYPEVKPLYRKLAEHLDISQEQIYLSAGSDAGIKAIYEVYVDSGDEVITIHPTYAMYYVYTKMFNAKLIKIEFDEKFVITHEQITEKISPKTKLVCIANPNSPTGTVFTIKDLEKIIQTALNNEALVLVDEAYYQFWGYSAVDLISVYDNLIVTRTFSKALGLASARLGYVLSTNEIISHLFRVRPIYEVNAFAVGLGIYTLEHPDIVIEYITEIRQARKWLEKKLLSDGFNVAKGFANFVLIDVGGRKKAAQITEGLLKEKIIIKGAYQEVCMEPYIRIGLGTLEQMKSFLKKFRKVLREIA